jgi:hypothetical protein
VIAPFDIRSGVEKKFARIVKLILMTSCRDSLKPQSPPKINKIIH